MEYQYKAEDNVDVLAVTSSIPMISGCGMTDCAFNTGKLCHAKSICIGDDHPKCDTYTRSADKIGDTTVIGRVGVCKVKSYSYNSTPLCSASAIKLSRHRDHADCAMYKTY